MLFLTTESVAQVAVNTTGLAADNSAMLDVESTTKGMLIPRMDKTQRDDISDPETGLMVFQLDNTPGFYYYNGSSWDLVGDGGATDINGLSDGRTRNGSTFLGYGAGVNESALVSENTGVGYWALHYNTNGNYNVAFGHRVLQSNIDGRYNTGIGNNSLNRNVTGYYNTAIGKNSLFYNYSGSNNIGLGYGALNGGSSGSNNTAVGHMAGFGSQNTSISGNVFLGHKAGYSETGNNKLYIENSDITSPLIYGEFDNDLVRINGDLDVTGTLSGMAINNLSDGITNTSSIFLGAGAGANDNGGENSNVAVGIYAFNTNTSGYQNTAIGTQSLYSNLIGNRNTAIGVSALFSNTSGNYNSSVGGFALNSNTIGNHNTAMGYGALRANTEGYSNVATGSDALYFNTTGVNNISIGYESKRQGSIGNNNTVVGTGASYYNQEGSNNTIIGYKAGYGTSLHSKSGNVFLGYQAGYFETGDNKLYIESSNSTTPLIYGNFTSDFITIHGNLGVGTKLFGNGTNTLCIENGTAPNASISDGILLYSEDAPTTSELKVRDEAGNITTLSPHNFSLTAKSEPMAWSYYSENASTGQIINVDMLRAVRIIEKLTGEKLAFIKDSKNDGFETDVEENTIGIIQQQQKEIDELKKLNMELIKRIEKLEK